MAVIPLQSQRRVSINAAEPNLIQPSRQAVDPVAGAVSDVAGNFSKLTEKLAEQEARQVELLQKNQIAADVSDLEIERLARVAELQINGTGDKPFVQGVLEDFDTRVKEVEAGYSPFMLQEFRNKVLPLKERVAGSALAIQMARTEQQIKLNTESFGNSVANNAVVGNIDELAGRARIAEYLTTVPEGARAGAEAQLTQQLQTAVLTNKVMSDPRGFLEDARANPEKYAEYPASQFTQAYEGAARAVAAEEARQERQRAEILALAQKDPLLAARQSMLVQGVENPTIEQLYAAQEQLGVHPVDRAVITRGEAETMAKNFQAVTSLDQLILTVKSEEARVQASGGDWNQVMRNMKQFGVDMHPALAAAIDYAKNPAAYKTEYGEALMEVAADPKAGAKAKDTLTSLGQDPKVVESRAVAAIRDDLEITAWSESASQEDMSRILQAKTDAALVIAAKQAAAGTFKSSKIADYVATPSEMYAKVITNKDRYFVPADVAKVLTPKDMDTVKESWLRAGKVEVPSSFPNRRLAEQDIRNNAGWVSYGEEAVQLTVRGAPVYVDGKPVIEKWSSLVAEYKDWKDKAPSPVGYRHGRPVYEPGVEAPLFRREAKKPAVAPQGLMLPPPEKTTPSGPRPRNPGELAPPTGME